MSRKVKFRTLKQQVFDIEISDEDLKIEKERGDEFPSQNLTLIHSGKVMENEKHIKDYKITDKNFIIVMSVAKPGEKSKPDQNPPPQTTPTTTVSEPQPTLPQPTQTPTTNETPNPNPEDQFFEPVMRALRASFNNPDRAVEYLISGNVPPETAQSAPEIQPDPSSDENPDASENPIAALTALPQFQQMREMVRQNPDMLPTLLQQLHAQNPELFPLIQENEQEFLRFLNESGTEGGATRPANQQQGVVLTQQEREAVTRLMELGFSEEMAAQAYFAFDRDEERAADFLFREDVEDIS